MRMDAPIIGLDIGGTRTAVVLGDQRGQIHARTEFDTHAKRGFYPVFAEMCACASRLLAESGGGNAAPGAVSVSIGGPLEIDAGIIQSPPNLPGWKAIPLKSLLAQRFGLPVYVEHDGNAGALAEWYFGAARGLRNVVFLTMGTGFGGGLILNGQLYRGTCDLAGEVGHVRISDTGPLAFGKVGSWEGLCGGAGIAKLAAMRHPQRWRPDAITAREIAELARASDAAALSVLDEVSQHLGRGLAMLIDILNPEMIVIGSLVVRLGELVLRPARAVVEREALPEAVKACRLVPAELGERLGDVASLCAAIQALGGPNRS
jgi:glucokinase